MTVYIVMGVSGCGKTTVGKALAEKLQIPFHDADDFHSQHNIEKMRQGVPLTDVDRAPWLKTIAITVDLLNRDRGGVIACSALKSVYRDALISYSDDFQFVYLKGSQELIAKRLAERENHYMNPNLLASQFAILEEPSEAITIDIDQPIDDVIAAVFSALTPTVIK